MLTPRRSASRTFARPSSSAWAGDGRGGKRRSPRAAGTSRPAIIDEAQRSPRLSAVVERFADFDPQPGQFVIVAPCKVFSTPLIGTWLPSEITPWRYRPRTSPRPSRIRYVDSILWRRRPRDPRSGARGAARRPAGTTARSWKRTRSPSRDPRAGRPEASDRAPGRRHRVQTRVAKLCAVAGVQRETLVRLNARSSDGRSRERRFHATAPIPLHFHCQFRQTVGTTHFFALSLSCVE